MNKLERVLEILKPIPSPFVRVVQGLGDKAGVFKPIEYECSVLDHPYLFDWVIAHELIHAADYAAWVAIDGYAEYDPWFPVRYYSELRYSYEPKEDSAVTRFMRYGDKHGFYSDNGDDPVEWFVDFILENIGGPWEEALAEIVDLAKTVTVEKLFLTSAFISWADLDDFWPTELDLPKDEMITRIVQRLDDGARDISGVTLLVPELYQIAKAQYIDDHPDIYNIISRREF